MKIGMLNEYPEFADMVIEWLNHEFGTANSRNFYKSIIEHSLSDGKLPVTFVAVEEARLLGTISLWRADLLSRQELYPWMSALVVNPAFRNNGIGKALQRFGMEYCKGIGIKELYLYTDLVGYYEKTDWVEIDIGYEYSGEEIRIYKHLIE